MHGGGWRTYGRDKTTQGLVGTGAVGVSVLLMGGKGEGVEKGQCSQRREREKGVIMHQCLALEKNQIV